jgi:aarF domain-containing kinase
MRAAKEELALECDYTNEALAQKKFRKLVAHDPAFYVPQVIDEFSTKRILTTERIYGVPVDRLTSVRNLPPSAPSATSNGSAHAQDKVYVPDEVRNELCRNLLRLVLNELFVFRFMQTDPNWSNFLYNPNSKKIFLIDFGASRLYKKQFVDESVTRPLPSPCAALRPLCARLTSLCCLMCLGLCIFLRYLRMVYACSMRDRQSVIDSSIKLGFLTGDESKEMMEAHVQAGYIIGEPFRSVEPYDFVKGNIAARVSTLAAVMLRDRLTPPPKEAYTVRRITNPPNARCFYPTRNVHHCGRLTADDDSPLCCACLYVRSCTAS